MIHKILILTLLISSIWASSYASPSYTETSQKYKSLSPEAWKKLLSNKQVHHICREKGTEKPFKNNKYDKHYAKGTYMCACCGGDFPLYKSDTKYDSKTGWPSFWSYIEGHLGFAEDRGFFTTRTEVLCARCGSHLGHVFDDGPKDKGGKRYCMNSLALSFVKAGETAQRTFETPQ